MAAEPDADADALFQPLGRYVYPAAPAVDTVQGMAGRLRRRLRWHKNQPVVDDDMLRHTALGLLDDVAIPPDCDPLDRALRATLAERIANASSTGWLTLVVLPPCDENDSIEAWARDNGHALVEPPDRALLADRGAPRLPDLPDAGVLVVPRLERWFLRHRNGLGSIRLLLQTLSGLQQHCVVGCNSWAWAFLTKAADADALLPDGLTFKAFDAQRLHAWFCELAESAAARPAVFRLSQNGGDVMATDEDGSPKEDYFGRLAARSLGIPWVAWRLWRRSLRRTEDDIPQRAADTATDGETTFWVAKLEDFVLPNERADAALLVLQALLIHRRLSLDELRLVLPDADAVCCLPGLLKCGVVGRQDAQLYCLPAAYPTVRSALATAGLPLDRL